MNWRLLSNSCISQCNGLQIRVPRFNSGRGLQTLAMKSIILKSHRATCAPCAPHVLGQNSGHLFVVCSMR